MTPNMGSTDRIVRLLLAAVLAAVLAGAAILTVTSLIRSCPLYLPFGIRTCSTKK